MKEETSYSKELSSFVCQSEWIKKEFSQMYDENEDLKPSLPFFWLLINHLKSLYRNYCESNSAQYLDLNSYASVISKFFEENSLYVLLEEIVHEKSLPDFSETLVDYYINDFLLISCKINNRQSLSLIKMILKLLINELDENYRSSLKYSLPMVHFVFDRYKTKFESYLKFSSFEPLINNSEVFKSKNYTCFNSKMQFDVDTDSCLEAIRVFKQKFELKLDLSDTSGLFRLLQLISEVLTCKTDALKLEVISQQNESLTVLRYFCDSIRKFNEDFDSILVEKSLNEKLKLLSTELFNKQIGLLNSEFFKNGADFKKKSDIQSLNEFLIISYNMFQDAFKLEHFNFFFLKIKYQS